MALPPELDTNVLVVTGGQAVDAMSASSGRAGGLLKCLGPCSVWVGARNVDAGDVGYRLRPGEELPVLASAGLYLFAPAGMVARVAVLEVS